MDPWGFSDRMMWVFESLFLVMMISNFFTDFIRDGEHVPCADVEEIAVHYL